MKSIMIITLIVHLVIYEQVGSSFLENETSSLDGVNNVLGKFFVALNRAYLEEEEPWYIVSIWTSTSKLHESLNPLFRRYPMVVCSNLRTCDYPSVFISPTLFIVFLEDLSQDTILRNSAILSSCTSDCKLLFVIQSEISINKTDILTFFIQTKRGELIHVNKYSVEHYSASNSINCTVNIETGFVWRPGNDLRKISSVELFSLRDHKGCPITVATIPYMSKVIVNKKEDGSFSIIGGRDGMLALTIAEMLNSTISLKYPESVSPSEMMAMVIFDDADFAMSRITPVSSSVMSFLMTFDDECVAWAVPRIMRSSYDVVWSEFPWDVWSLIGLVFVIGCGTGIPSFRAIGFVKHILNVVSIHLGIPVTQDPKTVIGKLVFLEYLCYATVMTTAYKTSLASILSTVKIMPTITDVHGIIEANLTVGGSAYHKLLIALSSETEVPWKLLERFEVYDNHTKAMDRLEVDPGFVYLASRCALTRDKELVVKYRRLIRFDILKKCAVRFPAAFVFAQGSDLIKSVNKIISRVNEFGLLDYWDHASYVNDDKLESLNADRFFGQDTMQKLISVFNFYFVCVAVCISVFLAEILAASFNK